MMNRIAALAVFSLAPLCSAQWLDFFDETGSRLVLTNAPANDDAEKDIAAADLDRDGDMDIVVARKLAFSSPGVRTDILLMNEGGVLTDRTAALAPGFIASPTDARDVIIHDFTGDGWEDVIVCGTFDDPPRFYLNRGNDGGGVWMGLADESAARLPALGTLQNQNPGPLFCGVWAGDVTGSGALDLYFANYNRGQDGATEDKLLINDGTGVFTDETNARLGDRRTSAFNTGAQLHDFDGDDDLDIIKLSTLYAASPWNDTGVYILFNDGAGSFTSTPFMTLPSTQPYMVDVRDVDGNGMNDVYMVQDGQDRLLLATAQGGNGSVTFSSQGVGSSRTDGFGGNTKMADLDRDGDLDVLVAPVDVDIANCDGAFAGEICLYRNDAGSLVDPYPIDQNIHVRPHDFECVDVNGDGALDLFMGLCDGWRVFIQDFTPPPCPSDLTGDGQTDSADLAIMLAAWGAPGAADLNGSGATGSDDLAVLLAAWGPCP